MEPIYLDYAATTPVRPEVREAMLPLLDERFGNPSSAHRWGRAARAALDEARARLAATLGASAGEIVFTRGGTEADNLAVLGRARAQRAAPVVCSAIEHRAVLAAARAAEAEGSLLRVLPVNGAGVVDVSALDDCLETSPAVVSVMWANNEIGTVQPVAALAARCAERGVTFHSDAIQAFGKLAVRVDETPVSLLSLSAHKIGGPKGVGALFVRRGVKLTPLVFGGGHERGLRAGTEDVAGAVGLATAAELAVAERDVEMRRLRALRDRLEEALREAVPELEINGERAERLPHLSSVTLPEVNHEALLAVLDLEGIAVSAGSACSSGVVEASHVLTAMGGAAQRSGATLRLSLGRQTTTEEVERVVALLPSLVDRVRAAV